ncbi:gamma-zein [Zea mays]|jgi:hypothetical protein|uniref:16 kDa gamma-zein n=3 Tax=Zea mays TaxID=4577 RepID=ZEB2_MAIZE|nr:16 kDa gamma-zein precursor [Zea mays]P08031.1 RecName: Full=16 kDa gamma-zein; AltName: Full=16 kDa zein; AltName: Full=Zein Zc1; AltName: Full=Zein-2; AltName: Full=Zein-gamma; Flags: Precursor [Zea mays]AAA33523.1 16-kDa zein protein [Zea mays]AAL16978.1 16kD gamma zein [Zea mays]ABD63258.1 16 kDa gamma zein [Zea mays]ACG25414.1 prolamin PPROL 17 precursor [Zea mays]ACG25735.1 prolamin PPROL 17 precursor [Zea mays]|eukprot:NP_001105337.1 prolamin 16 kDa gamma zein precursor [Zea mays]
MKVLIVALALLALAASAASSTSGGCGCQTPPFHLPPPFYMPPPFYLPPQQQPQPWQYPTQPPQLSPCQQFGSCGVGSVGSPFLGQCVEFLRHQCSPAATPYGSPQCQALQQQCCHQIRQVEPLHRYQATYGVVLQSFLQQQPQGELAALMAAQVAQQLTAMCGLQLQQPGPCPCNAAAGGVYY